MLSVLAASRALAQVDSSEIAFRSTPFPSATAFNPTVSSVTLGSYLKAHVALSLGPGNGLTGQHYYQRTLWVISSGATTVRSLEQETEFFPPIDVPPTRTFLNVDQTFTWDGKNTSGVQVADGTYTYTVQGQLIYRLFSPTGALLSEQTPASTSTVNGSIAVDTVNPVVSFNAPTNGAYTSSTPSFDIGYTDASPSSGLQLSTFRAVLDGTDISFNFNKTASNATYTVPSWNALSETSHTITGQIKDAANNVSSTVTVTFTVDVTPPTVTVTQPAEGASTTPTPTFQVSYSDAGSGVNISTLSIKLDGSDITSSFTITGSSATYSVPNASALASGSHVLNVQLSDNRGNPRTVNGHFRVVVPITGPTQTIAGTVRTGTSCNNQPLAGATVSLVHFQASAVTDSNGHFMLTAPIGTDWIQVSKAGYLEVQRSVKVELGSDAAMPDVYLVQQDSRTTHVIAAVGATVTDSTGNASLDLPPGALPQDMDITLTLVNDPHASKGPPLKNFIPGVAVRINPDHVTLNVPATVRVRNSMNMPVHPITSVDWDEDTQAWTQTAGAEITTDGQYFKSTITHFSGAAPG